MMGRTALALFAIGAIGAFAAAACAGPPPEFAVVASAGVEGDVPIDVELRQVGPIEQGARPYELVITSLEQPGIWIEDVRWTFSEVVGEEHAIATAGSGCGAEWFPEEQQVFHACTEEYRILETRPGAPLREPIRLYEVMGDMTMTAGTYTFTQRIRWWVIDGDEPFTSRDEADLNDAAITLTFEITER